MQPSDFSDANKFQIGGRHYKTEYEHWDLVLCLSLNYFEGCSTKYVTRWRKKGGLQDLRKALHYLNKMQESKPRAPERQLFDKEILREVNVFAEANKLTELERGYVRWLCMWQKPEDLTIARDILFMLFDEAEALDKGLTPAPLCEENHHAERSNEGGA